MYADEAHSFRLAYGEATENNLGDVLSGDLGSHKKDLSVLALDTGFLLKRNLFNLPIDIYARGGVSYFNEYVHSDVYEVVAYIKAYYNIDFQDNRVRFGLGEGASYVSDVLETEYDEALAKDDHTSNLLNYLDISLDFDIGKLINYDSMNGIYLGVLLKHRSGIFGLINDVKHGGSNYNSIYISYSTPLF